MTDLTGLNDKIANNGISDKGICSHTDWNKAITALIELQVLLNEIGSTVTGLSTQIAGVITSYNAADTNIIKRIGTVETNLKNTNTTLSSQISSETERARGVENTLISKSSISQVAGLSETLVMSQKAVKDLFDSLNYSQSDVKQIRKNKLELKEVKESLLRNRAGLRVVVNKMMPASPRKGVKYFFASGMVKICFDAVKLPKTFAFSSVSKSNYTIFYKTGITSVEDKKKVSAFMDIEDMAKPGKNATFAKADMSGLTLIWLQFSYPVFAEVTKDGDLSTLRVSLANDICCETYSPYLTVEEGRVVCRKAPKQKTVDDLKHTGIFKPFNKKGESCTDIVYGFKKGAGFQKNLGRVTKRVYTYRYRKCCASSGVMNKTKQRFFVIGQHKHHKSVIGVSVVHVDKEK